MMNNNQKKHALLGMNHGTAGHQLRKKILFSLIEKLEMNICFQCSRVIADIDDLSIEHKSPWMSASKPKEAFFDLENIAFSHLSCNVSAAQRPNKVCHSKEDRDKRDAELGKKYWNLLTKEEQKVKRRDKYKKYGC